MLGLLLILLLIGVAVAALLLVGTAVIQGYLYSEPVEGILWRSAVTGAAIAGFFGFWCWIEAKAPGRFDTLLNFTPVDRTVFEKIWSEQTGDRGKVEIPYTRGKDSRSRVRYFDADNNVWERSGSNGMMTAIIVEENGEKHRFEADLQNGRFPDGQQARYIEKDGQRRVMTQENIGEIATLRYGLLFGNLLLNLAHLLVWFLCLWLVLQFQWPHALGLALAFWLAFGMLIWPIVRDRVPHG